MTPRTEYARSGDVHIAYQVFGDGEIDLVVSPGFVSHVEMTWDNPSLARFYRGLGSFARVILFDKRGTGLSDRVAGLATLEERMDDVRAVMDAAGSERAALLGISEGGPMSILFSATYPERTLGLVLYGSFARFVKAHDYPWALSAEQHERVVAGMESGWGTGRSLAVFAPSLADDEKMIETWGRFERMAASPGAAAAILRMNAEIDVREILPAIRVPTLVLHRRDDKAILAGGAAFMAERIPGARYVELEGEDHLQSSGNVDGLLAEIEEFLTGARGWYEPDRVLATVLFTDIVASTERASELGDRRWRDLLEDHHARVRRELAHFRGREIDTAGDGFFATFDGPARGIRCAQAIRDAVRPLGIEVRAGLHTGECEVRGDSVSGIAVHIGARVMGSAGAGEVRVSSIVKDLVAGSGLDFEERGSHELKGVPGEWRLFSVA